jgi:hypothetical protein
MENLQLQLLAKKLNLTDLNEEKQEYILTPDEEQKVWDNAVEQLKKHKSYKFSQMGANEEQILKSLSVINYDEEINRTEIMETANSSKHYSIWQKEQRKKEAQEEVTRATELQTRCNAKYFYNLMAWISENTYGKKLILHDDNTPLIRAICFFFSRDERFETELKFDLNKGLLIRGVSGLGKTYLFKCIESNDVRPIDIVSMIDISEQVKEEGNYELHYRSTLYLDDVGTEEPIVNHYGTKINWFKNFIEMYYLKNKPFNRLVVSTNNSFDEIEGKYGFRVRSRVKDMFNIIDVQGKDMRGNY